MGMHKQESAPGHMKPSFYSTQHRKASAEVQSWALSTTREDQCELTWEKNKND